jgi:hypothetical protein
MKNSIPDLCINTSVLRTSLQLNKDVQLRHSFHFHSALEPSHMSQTSLTSIYFSFISEKHAGVFAQKTSSFIRSKQGREQSPTDKVNYTWSEFIIAYITVLDNFNSVSWCSKYKKKGPYGTI